MNDEEIFLQHLNKVKKYQHYNSMIKDIYIISLIALLLILLIENLIKFSPVQITVYLLVESILIIILINSINAEKEFRTKRTSDIYVAYTTGKIHNVSISSNGVVFKYGQNCIAVIHIRDNKKRREFIAAIEKIFDKELLETI